MCANCRAYERALTEKDKRLEKLTKDHEKLLKLFKKYKKYIESAAQNMQLEITKADKSLGVPQKTGDYWQAVGRIDAMIEAILSIGFYPPITPNYLVKQGGKIGRESRKVARTLNGFRGWLKR